VRYILKKIAVITIVGFVVSMVPFAQAHAGLFSFFSSFFGGYTEEQSELDLQATLMTSLHTMPLLSSPVNVEAAKAARGGAMLSIVNNNALVPASGPLGAIADVEGVIKTDRITLYTVREGDNLSVIAQMFGVTVNTILWANDIASVHLIRPGDVLIILPVSGVKHKVAEGDTIASITKKYEGDFDEILAFNGLTTDVALTVGSEIVIPGGEITAPPVVSSGARRATAASSGLKDATGYYSKPVAGVRSQSLHGYNAVDLAAPCGAPIYAAASGTVIVSKAYGWNGGYGNYIVITHANGTQTLYAHESSVWVSSGEYVTQGQGIGTVGSTGRSTGCHVHFEVRGARNPF
jgi:LysM repeat protein